MKDSASTVEGEFAGVVGSPLRHNAPLNPAVLTPHLDLSSVYRLLLRQLAGQLPVATSILVYRNPATGDRQSLRQSCQRDRLSFSQSTLAALEAEPWWPQHTVAGQLLRLPVTSRLHAYLYPLSTAPDALEYLLAIGHTAFSSEQCDYLQQQGHLCRHYLLLAQIESRQLAKIRLLEQVIQRSEHQLRNPLALIGLSAENLCLGLADNPLQQQAAIIRDTVSDLTDHLTDLLCCGQQAKLQIAPYDLRAILADSERGLKPLLAARHLHIAVQGEPVLVPVDRWQIKQVLDNLLNNAIHFSPPGATIDCTWHLRQDMVCLQVRDRGPGLALDEVQRVFAPFYSRRPGGQGLGLAIAHKIVLDHQGRLWATNHPEGGAQFSLMLPLHPYWSDVP